MGTEEREEEEARSSSTTANNESPTKINTDQRQLITIKLENNIYAYTNKYRHEKVGGRGRGGREEGDGGRRTG